MSLSANELYSLWSQMLVLVYKEKPVSLDEVAPAVRPKVVSAFEKVAMTIPDEVIPAYFSYVFKLCKSLKIRPTYKLAGSDKNINDFLASKRMVALVEKRKKVSLQTSSTESTLTEATEELGRFITEVKGTKDSLKCDVKEAIAIVYNKYLWVHRDSISYFINRVISSDTKALSMLG